MSANIYPPAKVDEKKYRENYDRIFGEKKGVECELCGEIIPANHVQQGGMHMECYASVHVFWRMSPVDDPKNSYMASSIDCVAEMIKEMGEPMIVEAVTMTAGEYFELPEFDGF